MTCLYKISSLFICDETKSLYLSYPSPFVYNQVNRYYPTGKITEVRPRKAQTAPERLADVDTRMGVSVKVLTDASGMNA